MNRRYRRTKRSGRLRPLWLTLTALVGVLLCFGLYKGVRVAAQLQSAYRDGAQFAQLINGNLSSEQYDAAQALLARSATALTAAEQEMAVFTPLLRRLDWLPLLGPTLSAIPTLMTTADELGRFAQNGYQLLQPVFMTPVGASPLAQLPAALAANQPQWTELIAQAEQLHQQLQDIDPNRLPGLLATPVSELQAGVALLAPALRLGAHLPDLLGVGQTRTYLVLAQNNHELRATGGFITAIGRITVADGKIVGLDFVDSYDPTISRIDQTLPQAPPPVQKYMHIDIMLLRDVNWSPDFPTTAQLARTIYTQQTGYTVDGVISVDLHAVEALVGALEPLTLPGHEQTLTSATVLAQIKEMWAAPLTSEASLASGDKDWWKQRKDFIPLLAKAAVGRLQQGTFSRSAMVQALERALDSRGLQLWLANGAAAQELARIGWDGGLKPPAAGDFLALVDSNFGYNKVDALLERTVQYQVTWPDGPAQPAVATVALHYRHPVARPNYICDQTPRYEDSYEEMMMRCYYDYVRLFVPAGSELLGSSGLLDGTVSSQRGEGGAQLFSGYFILAPGATNTVILQYRLPPAIKPDGYTLTVRRQAGAGPLALAATVNEQTFATTITSGLFTWP
ncbi:MAG: DUF4012 domain-containing protein [Caldilinea sp. CFX5]|nr:DUF4012 domain-containing protein [Caldilinea sp. CFX5]